VIYPGAESPTCGRVNEAETFRLEGLAFLGNGSFTIKGYVGPFVLIHEDYRRQLLVTIARGAHGFWFNASGFFFIAYSNPAATSGVKCTSITLD
jgi:hypothetical protein